MSVADDPYYSGLRARIPNFVKSRKKKQAEKEAKERQQAQQAQQGLQGHPAAHSGSISNLAGFFRLNPGLG